MKPNFFQYATNELSQDAFFCWLLKWSHENNKNVHPRLFEISHSFLKYIIPEEYTDNLIVEKCELHMQKKNMDFICNLNDSVIIHFEDKIKANTTKNQLTKYKKTLSKDYSDYKTYHIYLKTELIWQKERNLINENGYKIVDLFNVADILTPHAENDIYEDFRSNIKQRIKSYFEYNKVAQKKWTHNNWIGFIYDLSSSVNYHNFGRHYVGEAFWFIFSWFKLDKFTNSHVSFELVNKKCAIKAHVYDKKTNKKEVLNYVKELLSPHFDGYKLKSYNKSAKSMLLIEFIDFIALDIKGIIDFENTKIKLISINETFSTIMNKEN